jgi:Ca-activated chloride channel family protein
MPTGIDFTTLSFAEPAYLWLLAAPAALLALWVWQFLRRRMDARRSFRDRVVPVRRRHALVGDLAFWLCLIVATSSCILALARPHARVAVVRKAGADIVILQDGSASMYVTDVKPDRWRRSVRFVRAFADALSWKGDRVALALFAHLAAPQLRLTKDPNSLFFFLDHLGDHSPFRLEDNPTWDTNIEVGIDWGLKLVEKDEQLFGKTKNPKGFVVVTDGQAWSGDVAIALRLARERQVPVNVVGVGTAAGGLIPEPLGPDGTRPPATVRAVLDRDSLRQIAKAGGGEYFEIDREPDRDIAFRIIDSVRRRAKASEASQAEERYEDLYWPFLFAAGAFLCLGTFLLKEGTELWWQAAGALTGALLVANALR